MPVSKDRAWSPHWGTWRSHTAMHPDHILERMFIQASSFRGFCSELWLHPVLELGTRGAVG